MVRMGNWEVWEKNVLALADGHQGGGTEPRLLGGGRTGAGADPKRNGATWWRVRERLWARAPGFGDVAGQQRPPLGAGSSGGRSTAAPRPFWQTSPPQGAEEPRIRGPGGVQRDGKAPSLRNPTLKMPLEFTLFITFINIVILFPACRALIRNVGACTPRLVQMGRPGPGEETPTASTRPALDCRGPHPGHSRGFEGSPAGLPDVARPLGRGPFRAGGGSGKAGSSGISLHKGKGGRSPGLGAGMGAPGEGRGSPQRGPGQRGHSPGKADARGPERRPLKKGSGVRQVGTLRSLR